MNTCNKIIEENLEIHQRVPAWKKGRYWDGEGPSTGFQHAYWSSRKCGKEVI